MSVFVENTRAEIIISSEDSLIFKIPKSVFVGSPQIKIVVGDREVIVEDAFEVLGPVINEISKTEGYSGNIIIFRGN
jgi:hypothetical protein